MVEATGTGKIDTVIFDFGGVLYDIPESNHLKRWLRILKMHEDEQIHQMFTDPNHSELFWDVMRGKIKERDLWAILAKKWEIPSAIMALFQRNMMSKKRLNKTMMTFMKSLKNAYKVGILSNAGDETRKTMEKIYRFDQITDEIIISAEEGYAKPDREIYEIALDRLNSIPGKSLFIDDLPENTQAAEALGMRAIHHQNAEETIRQANLILGEEG